MKKLFLIIGLMLLVTACQVEQPALNNETDFLDNLTSPIEEETEDDLEDRAAFKVSATEGELVEIPVSARDPDGRAVSLSFQEPFNEDGLWLSQIGDAGRYLIRVQATDGLLTTTEYVLVELERAPRAPTLECPETITVSETETVRINCSYYHEDDKDVTLRYRGWMNSSTYTTDFGDRGNHTVIVVASDGERETTSSVNVFVERTNRPPVIEPIGDIEVLETETFVLTPNITDPDGDEVLWATTEPFTPGGVLETDYDDRGTYEVSLIASDGIDESKETFTLTILAKNRPPVLEPISPIEVDEGEVVEIPVNAYDPDGDDIIISYSGWMNSSTRQTTYDDAHPIGCDERGCTATYFTTVTVSDGELETSQVVEIRVTDVNRPPEFVWGN